MSPKLASDLAEAAGIAVAAAGIRAGGIRLRPLHDVAPISAEMMDFAMLGALAALGFLLICAGFLVGFIGLAISIWRDATGR